MSTSEYLPWVAMEPNQVQLIPAAKLYIIRPTNPGNLHLFKVYVSPPRLPFDEAGESSGIDCTIILDDASDESFSMERRCEVGMTTGRFG